MALYFANTEITGIKDLFPLSSKDITGLYFADTELFTVWGEYDGTLPAQFNANGSMLADYRIYGAAGGVGDDSGTAYGYKVDMCVQSTNLFDVTKITANTYVSPSRNGELVYTPNSNTSDFIEVDSGDTYKITWKKNGALYSTASREILFYNANKIYISQYGVIPVQNGQTSFTFTAPENAVYARFDYDKSFVDIMLTKGSTATATYIPYSSTTTPIYIGDTALEEDEYVDYSAGKIYRRTGNLWNGVYEQGGIDFTTGATFESANYVRTERMQCSGMTDIAFTYFAEEEQGAIVFYDGNGDYIQEGSTMVISSGEPTFEYHHSVPSGAAYVAISFSAANSSQPISPATAAQVTVVEGSTAPTQYIPPLQPEDPPVPLPALPTVDGVTITDYAGQSAAVPSRFYAKYRKEGFN